MSDSNSSKTKIDANEALEYVSKLLGSDSIESDWQTLNSFKDAISESFLMAKVNKEGLVVSVNPLFEKAIGYSSEELKGKPIHQLNSPLVPLELALSLWEEISQGNIWRGEISKQKKDGSYLWVRATIIPVMRDKEVDHFIAIYLDISERKKVESDLELFLSMLNFSNDAIQVADEDGYFQYVNLKSIENLGYSREDLLGKGVWETEKIFDDQEAWRKHVLEVKKNPQGMLIDGYNKRNDGSIFPVEVNVRHMILNNKGYVIAIIRDVSDRIFSQLQIQKNQQLLNEAQRIAKYASFELLPNTGTMEFSENMWRVLGFENESAFSTDKLPEILHPADRQDLSVEWVKVIHEGGLIDRECRIYSHSNELNYLKLILRAYQSEDGKNNRVIGTVQNITDEVLSRKQLEKRTKELEARNSELDQFAQIVSHDLKSPLRAIHNLSDWISEGLPDLSQDNQRNIELLKRRVERMENLINGILHYSSAGKLRQIIYPLDTHALLVDIFESIKVSYPNIETILKDTPVIECDHTAFEQIIGNLVSNAAKHNTNEKPVIEVSCEESEEEYVFSVKDNGPGIERAYHERIFKMFQTLLPRDTMENTGVGLAIVKKLCDQLNWGIELESSLGNGSVFKVAIPKTSN